MTTEIKTLELSLTFFCGEFVGRFNAIILVHIEHSSRLDMYWILSELF